MSGRTEVCDASPVQKNPSPENPSLHMQRYEPMVFIQSALLLHKWVPLEHSSRSGTKRRLKGQADDDDVIDSIHSSTCCTEYNDNTLPVHLRPFPTQPGAQLHLKLPAVLVQVAWGSQLWAPISHSLISGRKKTNNTPCEGGTETSVLMVCWFRSGFSSEEFLAP